MADLGVGEPEVDEPRSGVCLVALTVADLLGGCAVVREAVGFYDQAQVGPVEVDAVAVDACLCLWRRQAGLLHEAQEAALEI
jgi:hypothetical protein